MKLNMLYYSIAFPFAILRLVSFCVSIVREFSFSISIGSDRRNIAILFFLIPWNVRCSFLCLLLPFYYQRSKRVNCPNECLFEAIKNDQLSKRSAKEQRGDRCFSLNPDVIVRICAKIEEILHKLH